MESFLLLSSFFALISLGIAFYMLPTIVAYSRDGGNTAVVFLVNLLLGWTLLGWLFALLIACAGGTTVVIREGGRQ